MDIRNLCYKDFRDQQYFVQHLINRCPVLMLLLGKVREQSFNIWDFGEIGLEQMPASLYS